MGGRPPQAPVAESGGATWAPAGLAVDQPRGGPTSLLVATLRGERLLRVVLTNPGQIARIETAMRGLGRLREATFGPDGCLYVGTSNRDGRGNPRAGDDTTSRAARWRPVRRAG